MTFVVATGVFVGRERQRAQLTAMVEQAHQGHSSALVVRGDAGIGKTALLHTVSDTATAELRVIRIVGAESEMELAYAGLQQICAPLSGAVDELPDTQRNALRVALGHQSGGTPDRLLVGLALLTLLSEAGTRCTTAVVVDDAQWIDTATMQALAIVARRIVADRIAMIFAVRNGHLVPELTGLPDLALSGLKRADAQAIIAAGFPGRIDEQVLDNILTEAGGNPLVLLEILRAITPDGLAGGYGLAHTPPGADRIERAYRLRLSDLPADARTILLLAASDPAGRTDWLWAAADVLGIDRGAAALAETAGLLSLDAAHARFSHPLVRSAVYRNAAPAARRHAHAALAQVITEPHSAEHRAWHRAHATTEPDEDIAAELARCAERARARGGTTAAGAFLTLAADLTPDPTRRAGRLLDAAQAKLDAGESEAAASLVTTARDVTADRVIDARAAVMRARLAFATSRGRDAPALLLAAAQKMAPLDPATAREMYTEALNASIWVGRLATAGADTARAVAAAARHAPTAPTPPRPVDLLLDALIVRVEHGAVVAAPKLARAVAAFLEDGTGVPTDPRWIDVLWRVCLDVVDHDAYNTLNARLESSLRGAGALTMLPLALQTYAGSHVWAGNFSAAADMLRESEEIIAATGHPLPTSIGAFVAAHFGHEDSCRAIIAAAFTRNRERGDGFDIGGALLSSAVLDNGFGRYTEALAACTSALQHDDVGLRALLLTECAEAASRSGEMSIAVDAADHLTALAAATGTSTAKGMAARAQGLAHPERADTAFPAAIAHFEDGPTKIFAPRTRLVYGEWLRREKRRADARAHLRLAVDTVTVLGAESFAHRARRELRATGATVHDRHTKAVAGLTAQENQIASLAQQGSSNNEIGAQLFLSPRTVEWHLSRIFAKLGIRTRRDLRDITLDSS
ncbi:MAG: AAA family ATPase [Actinobacteria bacterium]|nr:AAA family ATPase [Actinomycetota bacterium]